MSAEAAAKAAKEDEEAAKAAAQEGRIKNVTEAVAPEEAERAKSKLDRQPQQQSEPTRGDQFLRPSSEVGAESNDTTLQSEGGVDAGRREVEAETGPLKRSGLMATAPSLQQKEGGVANTSPTNGKPKPKLVFSGAGEVSMEERRAMLAKYRSPGQKKRRTAAKA